MYRYKTYSKEIGLIRSILSITISVFPSYQAEQELKEELDRIRNLKIQEDVEREYRRRERDAAIKRNKEMKQLHEARVQQVSGS